MELKELLGLLDSYGLDYKVGGDPEKVEKFVNEVEEQFLQEVLLVVDDIKLDHNLNSFSYDKNFNYGYCLNDTELPLCA